MLPAFDAYMRSTGADPCSCSSTDLSLCSSLRREVVFFSVVDRDYSGGGNVTANKLASCSILAHTHVTHMPLNATANM